MPAAPIFIPAEKKRLYGRVALCGPTGSGKTWTALTWAQILSNKRIAFVDTENRSASYYADQFTFDVADWPAPYDAVTLTQTIRDLAAAGSHDVVIVDSFSHFWEGEGGILSKVDDAAARNRGNSYAGWKTGTPIYVHLIDTMRNAPMHVIVCMRSKMEYALEERNGKQVPVKMGMAPIMRAGVEYEFTVVGDLDLEHRLTVSKSRCTEIADKVAQPHRAGELAETFKAWLSSGDADDALPSIAEPPARPTPVRDRDDERPPPAEQEWQDHVIEPRLTPGQKAIVEQLNKISDEPTRVRVKGEFVEAFGKPHELHGAGDLTDAMKWASDRLAEDVKDNQQPELLVEEAAS